MNEISNKYQLEIDTINLLKKKSDAIFITAEKTNKNDFIILFRTKQGFWRFVRFHNEAKRKNLMFADIGLFEIRFSENMAKNFAFLFLGSYSNIKGLLSFFKNTNFETEPEYSSMDKSESLSLKKSIKITDRLNEKSLLHLLHCLSIEY